MSTKIYNGYRLDAMSFLDLHSKMMALHKVALKLARGLSIRRTAFLTTSAIDSRVLGFIKDTDIEDEKKRYFSSPASYAFFKMMDNIERVEKQNARAPFDDFSISVVIYPRADTKDYLATLYTSNEEMTSLWEKQKFVHEYPYYNNTDQPKGITDQEWRARGKEWDQALCNDLPCLSGWQIDLIEEGYMEIISKPDFKQVIKHIPTFSDRVKRMAYDFAVREALKTISEEKKTTQDALDQYFSVERFLRDTEEGKIKLQQARNLVSDLLPKSIDIDLCFKKIKDIPCKIQ